ELLELRRNASEYTDKGYKAAEKAIKDKYALKPTQQSSEVEVKKAPVTQEEIDAKVKELQKDTKDTMDKIMIVEGDNIANQKLYYEVTHKGLTFFALTKEKVMQKIIAKYNKLILEAQNPVPKNVEGKTPYELALESAIKTGYLEIHILDDLANRSLGSGFNPTTLEAIIMEKFDVELNEIINSKPDKVKNNKSDASIDGINNIPENTTLRFKRNAASKLSKILQSRRESSPSDLSFQSIISELKDQVPGKYINIQEFVDIINESNPNLLISIDSVNDKFIITNIKKNESKDKDTTNVNSTKKDTTDTTGNINDRSNNNNSTVLDIHNTIITETNSLDSVYTSSTANKARTDQMALKVSDDNDLKIKKDKADYTKLAYRVKDRNNKIKEDANVDMLDFNKVNVGTEVTFELADNDDQIINIYVEGNRKKTTWGEYSKGLSKDSDEYVSNLPIKIMLGGDEVAFVPVYTPKEGDTKAYAKSFKAFRANIISSIEKYGKDAVSSTIISRSHGKLNIESEAGIVLDNMPDVEIGIYTSNGFSGVHSSIIEDNITNSDILTYGHYYALTPTDVGIYTAIPIIPKKINKNIATSIAMAADVYISKKHTSQSNEVLEKMGAKYDLTTRNGLNNYIRLFTYPISAENSGKAPTGFISQFEKEVYDKDSNFNAISIDEFGISWAQGSQRSKENPAASNKITEKDRRNDKLYAKKINNLIAHLQLMYHQMDTSVINNKFKKGIVLLRGKENGKQRGAQLLEVQEGGNRRTISYREMIQRLYVTNVKADLIGNEDGKDKYSYRFQSVMHIDENIKIKDPKTNNKTTLLKIKKEEIEKKKKEKGKKGKTKNKKGNTKKQTQKDILAKKIEELKATLVHAETKDNEKKNERTDQMALTNAKSTVVLIDGLTAGTQRELILSIAESFARVIFKGKNVSISKKDETRIYNEWEKDLSTLLEISILDLTSLGKYNKLKKKDKLKYSELKSNIRRLNAAIDNFDTIIDMTMHYLGSKSTMTVRNIDGEMTRSDKAGEMIKKQLGDSKTMESTGKHTMSAELKRFLHFVKDYKFEDGVPVVKKNWVGKDMYMPADKAFNTLQAWVANNKPNYKDIMAILESKTDKHPWVEGFIELLNNASEKTKREFIITLNNHSVKMDFVMWSKTRDEYKVRIYSDNFNSLYREKLSEWNNLMKTNLVNVVNYIEYYDTKKVNDILNKIDRLEALSKKTPPRNSRSYEERIDEDNLLHLKEIFEDIGIEVSDNILYDIVIGNYYSKGKKVSFKNQFKGGSLLRSIRSNIAKALNKEEGTDKFESYGALDNSAVIDLAKVVVRDLAETGTTSFRVGSKPIQGYTNNHFLSNTFMDLHNDKLTEKLEKFAYNKYSSWIEYMRNSEGSNMFNFRYISLNPLKQKGSKNKNSSSLSSRVSKEHEVIKLGMFQNAGQIKKFIHIDEDGRRTEKSMRNAIYFYSTTSDKSKVMLVNGIAHDIAIDKETRIVTEETVDHLINTVVASEITRISAHQNTDFNHKGYDEGKNLFLIFPLLNNIPNIRDNEGKLIKDVLAIPGMRDQFRKVITEYVASQVNSKLAEWNQMGIAEREDAGKEGNGKNKVNASTYTYIDSAYVKHVKDQVGVNPETIRAYMANDFVINNLFAQHNFSTIVQGDIAQYYKQHPSNKGKSITDESYDFEKDSQDTYDNLGKRLAGDVAPGYETYNSDEAPDIRMGLLEDRLSKSEVYEYLKSALKLADSDSYGKIESADAQEFTTWKEHLTVMYNTGKLEEENYKRMMKSNGYFSDDDLAIILQPMKPVYVGNVLDNQVWRRYYIKSSSFPLLPQLTKGLQLDKLRRAMESQNVDRVAFGSAVKVGNVKTRLNIYVYKDIQGNTISDKDYNELSKDEKKAYFQSEEIRDDIVFELDKNVKLLPRKHMRIQQDIPYDGKKNKVTHSGQVAHNIFVNVQTILQQNPETAGLFEEFNSLYGQLHNYHMASFLEKMEYKKDGSYNKEKLQEIIVKEAIERNFSINDKIGLGIVKRVNKQTGKEFLDFEKPIWDAVSGTKMESLLMSLVDNKVRKLKFPGMSGVLGTEDGFSTLDANEYNTEVLEGDAGQAEIERIQNEAKKEELRKNAAQGNKSIKPAQPGETINIYAKTNENAELSNFAKRPFKDFGISDIANLYMHTTNFDGITWNTVEGAFQASKMLYLDNSIYIVNRGTSNEKLTAKGIALIEKFAKASGRQAKFMGSKKGGNFPNFNETEWNADSSEIMKGFISESFEKNDFEKKQLLATGNATLTHTQDKTKWGKEFPKILMEVRDELRGTQPSEPTSEVETIAYTPKDRNIRETFTVKGNKFFNSKGVEVFKENSVDRNKISGNLAVQRGEAQVVEYKGEQYVVNKDNKIMSVTTGKIMPWGKENGDRKAVLQLIQPTQQTAQITKIISGGQTGVDRIGLEVGKELGIETGGVAPKGYRTEKGTDISLKEFGLTEDQSSGYTSRTLKNLKNSDGTVLFGDMNSSGSKQTISNLVKNNKPYIVNPTAKSLKEFLVDNNVKTLNVAGNRGSKLTDQQKTNTKNILIAALKVQPAQKELESV
ncbi:MAG: putative molybdenum carrier protein, partial [Flavobacteriaceae bacterium]|nr:putative molybdenum carrier protein [Flavobacteriaceae bacterium]